MRLQAILKRYTSDDLQISLGLFLFTYKFFIVVGGGAVGLKPRPLPLVTRGPSLGMTLRDFIRKTWLLLE